AGGSAGDNDVELVGIGSKNFAKLRNNPGSAFFSPNIFLLNISIKKEPRFKGAPAKKYMKAFGLFSLFFFFGSSFISGRGVGFGSSNVFSGGCSFGNGCGLNNLSFRCGGCFGRC